MQELIYKSASKAGGTRRRKYSCSNLVSAETVTPCPGGGKAVQEAKGLSHPDSWGCAELHKPFISLRPSTAAVGTTGSVAAVVLSLKNKV